MLSSVLRLSPLVVRNLARNPRRTLLTIGSMAVPFFLLMMLQTAVDSMARWRRWSEGNLRFAVYHRAGLAFDVPEGYVAKLAKLDGVKNVAAVSRFGGVWRQSGRVVPSAAVEAEPWRRVWPEGHVSDADFRRFLSERTGCLIEQRVSERYGWKIGDSVTLSTVQLPEGLTFKISGILTEFPDANAFYFHRRYLEETMGRPGLVTLVWVVVDSAARMTPAMKAAEALFANSPCEVKAELEKGFVDRIIYANGNIQDVVGGFGTLVVAVVILMAANSISMSVRERTTEIAVMKALGYSRALILALILSEAALLGFLGGVVGCWVGYVFWSFPPAMRLLDPWGGSRWVPLAWAAWAAFKWTWIAPLAGMVAGFVPAWGACRLPVAATLRRTA
jgi:putative ABC transport system permease protein